MLDQGGEQNEPGRCPNDKRGNQNPSIILIHKPQNLRQAGPEYFTYTKFFQSPRNVIGNQSEQTEAGQRDGHGGNKRKQLYVRVVVALKNLKYLILKNPFVGVIRGNFFPRSF